MHRFASDTEIDHIGHGLVNRTLPKPQWTHTAHFAAAFWILRRSDLVAVRDMPGLIKAYNESTGVPNTDTGGYHETITLGSLRAADAWLRSREGTPLYQALNELLGSDYGRSDWMLVYWSKALLFSVAARRGWVEPDLLALPF